MSKRLTREEVEQRIEGRAAGQEELVRLLLLLRVPGFAVDPALKRAGAKVAAPGTEHDVSLEGLGVPDGGLVFSKRGGAEVLSLGTLRAKLNKLLAEAFPGYAETVTMRTVQKLYAPPPAPTGDAPLCVVEEADLIPVAPDEYAVDPEVADLLRGYAVYTTGKDNAEGRFYPFVAVEMPDGAVLRYDVYKMAAGLPYYTRFAPEFKLPTVDHIGRDTHDNCRASLRYCTFTQNAWNKCRTAKQAETYRYHSVGMNCAAQIAPVSASDRRHCTGVFVWFALASEFLASSSDFVVDARHHALPSFDLASCKREFFEDIPEPHRPLLSQFVEELLGALREGYTGYTPAPVPGGNAAAVSKATIVQQDLRGRPLLQALYAGAPEVLTASRTVRPEPLAALAADACKLLMHGPFAHTNFLRVPPVPRTVADSAEELRRQAWSSPTDILNAYQPEVASVVAAEVMARHGVQLGSDERVVFEESSVNAHGKRIAARIVSDSSQGSGVLRLAKAEQEDGRAIIIASPFTAYYCPPRRAPLEGDAAGDGAEVNPKPSADA